MTMGVCVDDGWFKQTHLSLTLNKGISGMVARYTSCSVYYTEPWQ